MLRKNENHAPEQGILIRFMVQELLVELFVQFLSQ
jgi:hypothetical protein